MGIIKTTLLAATTTTLIMLSICHPAIACCQQDQSTVEQGVAVVHTVEITTYNDTEISEKTLSKTERDIAIVRTNAPNPLVRAYLSTNPFPPVKLNQVDDTGYLLTGEPGSKWTVEIIAPPLDDSLGWWIEYLEVVIKGKSDDPVIVPPIDPVGDHSELTSKIKKNPSVIADRTTAESLRQAFSKIDFNSITNLQDAIKAVGDARKKTFENRENLNTNWNIVLIVIDRYLDNQNPTTVKSYASIIQAIMKGLE